MINKVFTENVKNVYDVLIKKMSNYFSLKNHNHKLVNLSDVNLTGATQGNYISYDNGIWVPTSGSSSDLSIFYTKQQTDNNFLSGNTTIGELNGYTKNEVDNLLTGITTDLSSYYTSGQTDILLSTLGVNSIYVTIDGNGEVILPNKYTEVIMPYDATITAWIIHSFDVDNGNDLSGSIVVDIKRSGTSIIGAGNKPTLTTQASNNATVASWTSASLALNDVIQIYASSVTSCKKVSLIINITKS
ncbi:hypothetical protein M0Q50_06780 [bacterium]|jgi:hypothetical protein|nr:hypothetical protein [bacterium]